MDDSRVELVSNASRIGVKGSEVPLTVAIDKLDKIGKEKVEDELRERGFSEESIEKLQPIFEIQGADSQVFDKLKAWLKDSETGLKGIEELEKVWSLVQSFGLENANTQLDITLARGLSYYTGAIFEVAAPAGVAMGSIGGGGRYDDLTGIFDAKNKMSGVGISFGLDRIALVIEELGLFPNTVTATSKALFLNFGDKEALYAMQAITKLRSEGLKVELYPDNVKIGKQFQHADKRGIPFAILVGEEEMNNNQFTVKNLASGEQQKVDYTALVTLLHNLI